MIVKFMEKQDKDFVMSIDQHVNDNEYNKRVYTKTGYIMWEKDVPVGIMHYSVLWDNIPFLNFLFVDKKYRNKRVASQTLAFWENQMKQQGYKMTMVSTQADEDAQHFYRKLGYIDCGGLVFNHTPFDQPMELFFRKVL
ncbi:GNAT family N-acetyltransferase [Blautia schinkii]|nr:GNAT family N-acetyltransferase [Blautia schinkii]